MVTHRHHASPRDHGEPANPPGPPEQSVAPAAPVVPVATDPAPAPPTLADQQRDFTAEGSPPPGAVSGAVPAAVSASASASTSNGVPPAASDAEPAPLVGAPAPRRRILSLNHDTGHRVDGAGDGERSTRPARKRPSPARYP